MNNILVVGWSIEICKEALYEMLEDHCTDLIIQIDRIVDLKDNMQYKIITNKMNDPTRFRGVKYDQVIYVDDFRFELFKHMSELYYWVTELLYISVVPDNYKVIYYEYPLSTEKHKKDYYNRRF